ncbi:MAG: Na+/H+ antiporter NhaC family protein [Sphaerochaetaceae bacterium]
MIHDFYEGKGKNQYLRFFITAVVLAGLVFLLKSLLPENVEDYGMWSLVPAAFLVIYIFVTKRILESLILASLMCFIMADGWNFFTEFNTGLISVMMSEDIAWLIIVCGLMGSLIKLIEKAGGTFAFGQFVAKHAKSRRSTLVWTWVLGLAIFLDDYLNSLTVGSCMSPITDKHKVSREYLAYIVDSTAAPDCVLIPVSTWAVFASKLIAKNGACAPEDSFAFFCSTIPFNFYAWFAAFMVLFVVMGWFPLVGRLKKAEKRVADGGPLAPPDSDKIDIRNGQDIEIPKNPKIINFVLPIVVLIGSTIAMDIDMQKGVIVTLGFMFLFYVGQGLMTAGDFADYCIEGLKNMLLPILLMILAFLFSYASDRINFTMQVINSVVPAMQKLPQLMPFLVFLVLGMTEFITGTNWGMYIIALPIVIPLSQAIGGNTVLAVAAVLSAGVFGSHICFYSDATILSSSASGCNNFDHAMSQLPYGLICAGISAVCFLIAGFATA